MAGGFGIKNDSKWKNQSKSAFSSEVLKDSQGFSSPPKSEPKSIFSLKGILTLGQSVNLSSHQESISKKGNEVFYGISHLEQEHQIITTQKQEELEKAIKELQSEIQKLVKATDNLEKDVQVVASTPITETNEYQVRFLDRIRNFISDFRKNISEAGLWLESFTQKKKKKNYFWSMARDKKKGGDQYLFSNEHSAARSVN